MQRFVRLSLIFCLSCLLTLGIALESQSSSPRIAATTASSDLRSQATPLSANHLTSGQTLQVLVDQAQTQYDRGQFEPAARSLRQAQQQATASGQTLLMVQLSSLLALTYQQLGQWDQAQSELQTALSHVEQLRSVPSQERNRLQAQLLNTQGKGQWSSGQLEAALQTWQQAETHYQAADDAKGILGSQLNQVQALESLGLYRRAETRLSAIEKTLNQRPDDALKSLGLLNLGKTLRLKGEVGRSSTVLNEALEIAQSLNSATLQSQILLNIGNVEQLRAERAEAIQDRQQAAEARIAAAQQYEAAAAIAPVPQTQVQAQLNRVSLLTETSLINKELNQLDTSIRQLPAGRDGVFAQVKFAQLLLRAERFQQAQEILAIATAQADQLNDRRSQSYAQGALGHLYEQEQRWDEARDSTQAALRLAQEIRAAEVIYQWQWQMGRILQQQSEADLTQASLTKTVAKAVPSVAFRESSRNHLPSSSPEALSYYAAAYQTLNSLRSDLVALSPEVQFSFRETVEPVYREYVDLLLRRENSDVDPSAQSQQSARIERAIAVIESLQLAEIDNFFRDACAQVESVNLVQELDRLAPSTAILYPILLPDRLELVLRLPGDPTLRLWSNPDVSEATVDAAVRKLQRDLRRPTVPPVRLQAQSQQLYNWLIRPFEAELESTMARDESRIKTLTVIPDGSLRNLPLSVLHDGQRYLVERYALAVTPGLQLFNPQPLQSQSLRVLLAGTSDAPSFSREGFGAIGSVNTELEQIKQITVKNVLLKDQEFLQQAVQQQLATEPFNIVHLATHGSFSSNPDQTFILDWEGRVDVRQFDEMLRTPEPTRTDAIELLILSACETAKGDKRAALGLAGMAVRAGARSTMASLWTVDDAATAEFMVRFYEELTQNQVAKADAIRNVQLSFLTDYPDTAYNRPYYWAPFVLLGNWL